MTIAGTDLADTPAAAGLRAAKRVVIKVGSALLVDETTGRLRDTWLQSLADDIARMRARGQEVIVVSSGAIALGRRLLGLGQGVLRLEEKQAAAATGQIRLAHAYETVLGPHGIQVAQVLLTLEDSEARRRYLNARATLGTLLRLGAVPVINENDTVATAEIRFGDNDRLSARVAEMASADLLLLLSDIDGLYTADPGVDPTARHIPRVPRLTPRILAMGGGSRSAVGTGGMATKLAAARVASCAHVQCGGPRHQRGPRPRVRGRLRSRSVVRGRLRLAVADRTRHARATGVDPGPGSAPATGSGRTKGRTSSKARRNRLPSSELEGGPDLPPGHGLQTPHIAIEDPTSPTSAPARKSVEVRVVAAFPKQRQGAAKL